MKKIKVGILGAAGYTGGELIRILLNHPFAEIEFAHSRSQAGKSLYAVHADLLGDTHLCFTDALTLDSVDVLFLCLGHGESRDFLVKHALPDSLRIIDLTTDFRHQNSNTLHQQSFVYGLTELNRDRIKQARFVANPGCFATAIQLGLLPLAKAGQLPEIHTTGITGSTGAGQSLSHSTHFSWRANNIQPYKTLTHQHGQEIGESLMQLSNQESLELNFVPWRGDFTRGIFISSTLECDMSTETLNQLYSDFYTAHPFTHLSQEPIFLKQVVNTNKALIQLEKVGSKLVVHSVIDNLLKGASGQAVQNMNLLFDLPETAGLQLKASYF
ncbi:MAG: N-acetyl-gamma-glutamyl-phosphate reductase [Bacteroidota bacterium]